MPESTPTPLSSTVAGPTGADPTRRVAMQVGLGVLVLSSVVAGALLARKGDPTAIQDVPTERLSSIARRASGVSAGLPVGQATYVFFDPRCPYCTVLWGALQPLTHAARFVWVPVGVLSKESAHQAAAILAARYPFDALSDHEDSMAAHGEGIAAPAAPDTKAWEAAKQNTSLFAELDSASVPLMVGVNRVTGQEFFQQGSMTTEAAARLLGLPGGPSYPLS